ncbi:hypothetical protein E2C01_062449 [Portunus trituberculatus]|uniref:Uncharacterized protein n=1 Tax=Portunus trituberculatus TaxID=210409 RepID=A0A5B7H6G9_PORTR|nr:hypothetical protein [Portunus trituberculatus]
MEEMTRARAAEKRAAAVSANSCASCSAANERRDVIGQNRAQEAPNQHPSPAEERVAGRGRGREKGREEGK